MVDLSRPRHQPDRFIYLACPWAPMGGGMFRMADYLIQAQSPTHTAGTAQLRPLDTRGSRSAAFSMLVLGAALGKVVAGRVSGRLAGVHVNIAERLSLFRKGVLVAVSRLLGVPVVLHLHAAQLHHFYRSLPAALQRVTRWIFSLADQCVVLGAASRQFVVEELGVSPDRVQIINNGVPEPTHARQKASTGGVRQVLFVGNLSERKGVSDLLHAIALPEFDRGQMRLTLAGGGDIDHYRKLARHLGIDGAVQFEGWCDQGRVARLMACANVLVLPSYDEGLPLVILEALGNGVAVVCTPVGEVPSVINDGVEALFVQPGDVAGIAAAIGKVLTEPTVREALERNGRALYEREFSLSRFSAAVAKVHHRHFGVAALHPAERSTSDSPCPVAKSRS